MKKNIGIFFSSLVSLILIITFPSAGFCKQSLDNFTLDSRSGTIRDLAIAFTNATGFDLLLSDAVFYDIQVQGSYKNVALASFLSRVLKGYNYATVIDNEHNAVIVDIYDKPVNSKGSTISNVPMNTSDLSVDDNIQFSRIIATNEKENEDYLNNPDSIDPLSGLTIKELKERSELAEIEIEKLKYDSSFTDPFSGATTLK